jgi:hypothetical protein
MWYYAGSYKAFKLDDLSVKEWSELSPEVRLILFIHGTPEYLCRPHRPLLKKLSPEGKMRPLRILTKLRNFTLLVLSELPVLGCSVLVSTKRFINPSLNTLLSSARPNGNHLMLALMFLLLLLVVLYNLVLPRRLV